MAPFRSVSLIMAVSLMAVMLNTCVEAAPAERGFLAKPAPFLSIGHARENRDSQNVAAAQEKTESSEHNPSGPRLRWWPLGSVPTAVAGLTRSTVTTRAKAKAAANGGLVRVPRSSPEMASPDGSAQMLKMISALEELYRTINGTLSKRIRFMPRANGRNSAKKNKVVPASEAVLKLTTVPPMETGGTVSRASTDNIVPSLSGRNFKKSIPPQPKKSNKRVCFWKYCSQN